jgi:hypothetical protein
MLEEELAKKHALVELHSVYCKDTTFSVEVVRSMAS